MNPPVRTSTPRTWTTLPGNAVCEAMGQREDGLLYLVWQTPTSTYITDLLGRSL